MKPLTCPRHGDVLIDSGAKFGRRPIWKCPRSKCPHAQMRPRPTPKRAKDLELTQIPLDEHDEQARFVAECRQIWDKYPALELLFAVPNGVFLFGSARLKQRLASEGLKAGVGDLMLPVARSGYHGLFVEMKVLDGGVLSAKQKRFRDLVTAEGYAYIEAHGWKVAWAKTVEYLEGRYVQ